MYHGNGFLAGRCVIPIRDEKSHLVAYVGRAVNGEEPNTVFLPASGNLKCCSTSTGRCRRAAIT